MSTANIIDRLDQLITKGLSISDLKPHLIDARDQAVAFDKTLSELQARNETLVISLETAELRNTALAASNAELVESHAKEKEGIATKHAKEIAEFEERERSIVARYQAPEPNSRPSVFA